MKSKNMVLEYPQDYKSWEKLVEHAQSIEGLTAYEKERSRYAFGLLRKDFGEEFLKEVLETNHPFQQYITNTAPWTRRWLIWFAEAINEVKSHANFNSLVSRLRDREKYAEGMSVLSVGYKFSKVGFKLTFDQTVDVSGRSKVPDIHVRDDETKEEFYAEVSILGESVAQKDAMETLERLNQAFWQSMPFLCYCGRIHKTLSRKHLDEVVTRVSESVRKATQESSFREMVIEGVVELGMAPESGMDFLEKWANERGLKIGSMTGPPIHTDEVVRISRKIEVEQKQLPLDKPNVVVLVNNDFFFGPPDIKAKINILEEAVYEYPHLLASVVTGQYMGMGENKTVMKDQHVFVAKGGIDPFVEQHLILLNKCCNHKVYPATITKIYNSFFRSH